jgi:ubiquinol-cytochrome c reductase cytochrome b subunit
MLKRIARWIDDRWPLRAVLRLGRDEEIAGGASFAYTIGSATLAVFVLQVVTGIWQLFYYVPTVDHAYDSLNYFRDQVPFGWLIHGLHYWGAAAMVVLVGLHLVRVFLWAAYKHPRQLTWLVGVALLLLTAALSFTGAPLPWDERGYWAAEVGASIAGTVPFIGETVKRLMLGGDAMGQLTLSRFFILHAALLPGAVMLLVLVHLVAFRKFGSVGPWREKRRAVRGRFWPDQALKDAIVGSCILLILIGLAAYRPPPFSGPADPMDSSYTPRPEWNFLFLYQALKFFPGRFEPVGTLGIPLLIVILLILLPFIDRSAERAPRRRLVALSLGGLWLVAILGLTVAGYYGKPGRPPTKVPAQLAGSGATLPAAGERRGAALFRSLGCRACHRVNGTGGTVGPDLSNEALRHHPRSWLKAQVRDPGSHFPDSAMPAFDQLGDRQLSELADYLSGLGAATEAGPGSSGGVARASGTAPGPGTPQAEAGREPGASPAATLSQEGPPGLAARMIGSPTHGAVLFKLYCRSCHGSGGAGGVRNPGSVSGKVPALAPIDPALFDTDPEVFAENLDRVVQHGLKPAGPSPALTMMAFGDRSMLSQQEIADIEAYVLRLNRVNRASNVAPGIAPRRFFLLALGSFAFVGVVLGGIRLSVRRLHRRGHAREA